MDPLIIVGMMLFGVLAGTLGLMFGLGGGIILVPVLTIIYGLTATEAAAVSLVGILAASAGGSAKLIRKRASNIKLGLLLEIPTALGAILGAFIAIYIDETWLLVLFGMIMIYSGFRMIKGNGNSGTDGRSDKEDAIEDYDIENVPSGMAVCGFAGAIASMTGVGGGMIKVPLMNVHMGVPMKAATATSNYMIGITAFSGAIVYFIGGEIILVYAAAVAVGAFIGSYIGLWISSFFDGRALRKYFSVVAFAMAVFVLLKAGGVL